MGFGMSEQVMVQRPSGREIFGKIVAMDEETYRVQVGSDEILTVYAEEIRPLSEEEYQAVQIEKRAVEILKSERPSLRMSEAMEIARMEAASGGRRINERYPALPAGTPISAHHFVNDLPVRIITLGSEKATILDLASNKPQVVTVDRSEIETRWMTAKEWETEVGLQRLTRQPSEEHEAQCVSGYQARCTCIAGEIESEEREISWSDGQNIADAIALLEKVQHEDLREVLARSVADLKEVREKISNGEI